MKRFIAICFDLLCSLSKLIEVKILHKFFLAIYVSEVEISCVCEQ